MNKKQLEIEQLDSILGKGIEIRLGRRKFVFREPFLQTMDELSAIAIKLQFDENELSTGNTTVKINEVRVKNSKLLAKWLTVFYLEKSWKIKLFGWYYLGIFYRNTTARELFNAVMRLRVLENDPSFINSSRLIAQMPRTTEPTTELEEN